MGVMINHLPPLIFTYNRPAERCTTPTKHANIYDHIITLETQTVSRYLPFATMGEIAIYANSTSQAVLLVDIYLVVTNFNYFYYYTYY